MHDPQLMDLLRLKCKYYIAYAVSDADTDCADGSSAAGARLKGWPLEVHLGIWTGTVLPPLMIKHTDAVVAV